MFSLVKLFLIQKKAKIRHLFSKPTSAIFSIVMLLSFAVGLFFLARPEAKSPVNVFVLAAFVGASLVLTTLFNVLTVFQKRKVLFVTEDAHYLFIGPYSNRQILMYSNLDLLVFSLLFGCYVTIILLFGISMVVKLPLALIMLVIVVNSLYCFFMQSVLRFLYVKDMIKGSNANTQKWVAWAVLGLFGSYSLYSYFQSQFNWQKLLLNFTLSNDFNFIPFVGWGRGAVFSFFYQDYLMMSVFLALIIISCLILYFCFIHLSGSFYEQAMIDAMEFSDAYKKIMAGKRDEKSKVYTAKMSYRLYSGAIFSKNLLLLKKTRAFVETQDLIHILFAVILAFDGNELVFYPVSVLYLMSSIRLSNFTKELKINYLYLIPDNPKKKLFFCLLIPLIKNIFLVLCLNTIGLILLRGSLTTFMSASIISISLVPLFLSCMVLTTRLLKSRQNKVMKIFVEIVVMLVACIPVVSIAILIEYFGGTIVQNFPLLVGIATAGNLGLSLLIFNLCAPMLSGNAYLAE